MSAAGIATRGAPVTLDDGPFGTYLLTHEDGRDVLFQVDYDYPALASHLGWNVSSVRQGHCHITLGQEHDCDEAGGRAEGCDECCEHDSTDGTVDCDCGVNAMTFIASAQDWLDAHIGESFEDPGYFDSDS